MVALVYALTAYPQGVHVPHVENHCSKEWMRPVEAMETSVRKINFGEDN
jgi:hypothetical protein